MTVRALLALFRRDLALAWAQGGAAGLVLAFYALAVLLFPFGVGPDPAILSRIAAGILWISALLAALLSLDRLFQADYEDGSLDALQLGVLSPGLIALVKALAHWVSTLLPLVIVSPVFGIMLQLEGRPLAILVLGLLLGTPALSFIGAAAAALTVAVRRGGALVALLVLPLYIPPLIFGVAAVEAAAGLGPVDANLSLLAGITLFSAVFGPWAAGAAIRLASE